MILRPVQQARSTGSMGSILLSQGSAARCIDQENALVDAPDHERPCGTVPEAADDHRQHQVAVVKQGAAAVAAQRDVQVIARAISKG